MSKYSEKVERRRREAAEAFAYEPPERLARSVPSVTPVCADEIDIGELEGAIKSMREYVTKALGMLPAAEDCTGPVKMEVMSLAGMLTGLKVRLDAYETRTKSLAFAIALQEAVK